MKNNQQQTEQAEQKDKAIRIEDLVVDRNKAIAREVLQKSPKTPRTIDEKKSEFSK